VVLGLTLWPKLTSATSQTTKIDLVSTFADFRSRFNKTYDSLAEMRYRMSVFEASLAFIAAHNALPDTTYTLGINQFSDITWEEFAASHLNHPDDKNPLYGLSRQVQPPAIKAGPPDEKRINWYERGVVARVKNMGSCRANYAFAITAIVEEAYALFHKTKAPVLSEQEVIDCSKIYENQGCQGGSAVFSMYYIRDFGVNTAKNYPYTGKEGECRKDMHGKGPYRPKKWWTIDGGPERMLDALVERPLTAGMVIQEDFKHYKGGIYNPKECKGDPRYQVNSIGFDISTHEPHFIAKNFWGESWGEKGFFRIAMAPGKGVCGFTGPYLSTYAIIEPKEQEN